MTSETNLPKIDFFKNHRCYLCHSDDLKIRTGKVRNNDSLKVLECQNCGLVFLSSFDHINDTFYENSGMHETEVNLDSWREETNIDDSRRFNFLKDYVKNKKVIDIGCGNGEFLIKVKDLASVIAGVEPEKIPRDYLNKRGIKTFSKITEVEHKYDVVTCFHVIEHVLDPVEFLSSLKNIVSDNGIIIIETPNSNDALLSLYESKAFQNFTYWDCHLFLFNKKTMTELAIKSGLNVSFFSQIQRFSLSNHLYWLAKDQPGGHFKWDFFNQEKLMKEYNKTLASIEASDTIIVGFKK